MARTADVECVLDIRAELGECPIWSAEENALYWIDIYAGRLNRFDPASGQNRAWTLPEAIGSFALWSNGVVLVALKSGLWRYDLETEQLTSLASPETHLANNRLNDGRCDPKGRFWVGSMEDPVDPARPQGSLYRFDAEGCYWMAGNDGWEIVRFTPKGKIDRRIALPVAKPSMVAFGGPKLDIIYVTSIRPAAGLEDQPMAGSLFAVDAGVTGLPEPRYNG